MPNGQILRMAGEAYAKGNFPPLVGNFAPFLGLRAGELVVVGGGFRLACRDVGRNLVIVIEKYLIWQYVVHVWHGCCILGKDNGI